MNNNKKKNKLEIQLIDIARIIPAEYNPRAMTAREDTELQKSLDKFGQVEPLVINMHPDRSYRLIGGHQRLRQLIERGDTEVECSIVYIDNEEDEKELNVRLNKNNGHWDMDTLANHFDVEDLISWGFNEIELGTMISGMEKGIEFSNGPEDDENETENGEDNNPAHIRQVQLFFDETSHPEFITYVKGLTEHYQTDNLTDTIMTAVKELHGKYCS